MLLVVTIILDTPAGGASMALNSTVPVGWVGAQPAASTDASATRDTSPSHPLKFIASHPLAPPKASLPVEVRDNSHYANDDEINTNQIIEYLGENHNDNAENEACYSHP
jgi:hypothetical protein